MTKNNFLLYSLCILSCCTLGAMNETLHYVALEDTSENTAEKAKSETIQHSHTISFPITKFSSLPSVINSSINSTDDNQSDGFTEDDIEEPVVVAHRSSKWEHIKKRVCRFTSNNIGYLITGFATFVALDDILDRYAQRIGVDEIDLADSIVTLSLSSIAIVAGLAIQCKKRCCKTCTTADNEVQQSNA